MIDLKFDRVSKRYLIRHEGEDDGGGSPIMRKLRHLRRRPQEFWAVKDVSFEVQRGEALGIIGSNGAGKSTILKLLSNITTPYSGEITINGRLSALIEVGSGFHPELTGRENVYLSGSILGMRRREITSKLDSIIDFAGIRQFIDTPVKRFSSGMYVRLGFSIAAHLDPDILLLDEVLAVGDAAFQAKCLQRIKELEDAGTTIVFISHDLGAVERLCSRVLLMDHGQLVASGPPAEIINEYVNTTRQRDGGAAKRPSGGRQTGAPEVTITGFEMFGADGTSRRDFSFGEEVRIRINVHADGRLESPLINFGIMRGDDRVVVCNFNNWYDNFKIDYIEGDCTLEGWLPPLRLIPHFYQIYVVVWQRNSEYFRGDLGQMEPLVIEQFGGFSISGPALTASNDGVFQQPARKWVLSRNGQRIECDEIAADSLEQAFEEKDSCPVSR